MRYLESTPRCANPTRAMLRGSPLNLLYDWIRDENIQAWAELTNHLAVVDCTDEFYEPQDLLEELHEPNVDPQQDTVAVWDRDRLVGFAQLRVGQQLREGYCRASINGGVRLEYRRQGVGTTLMEVLETRAVHKSELMHPGAPTVADMWGNSLGHSAGILAETRGYRPARYFQDMNIRPKAFQKRGAPAAPKNHHVLLPYSDEWAEAIRLLDNEAFADHWGSTPKSADEWRAMATARSFRARYSRVLVEEQPDGLPSVALSYVLSSEWVSKELYVARVGTARMARGQGHAARLLSDIVAAAFTDGFAVVGLSVDADSPTGAVGLYERLGFSVTRTGAMYRKQLPTSRSVA